MSSSTAQLHRAGFACFVGRPNAGKSTLMNELVGQKVAITSSRPQTTRHTIRGIVHRPDAQLVLVDTPGLHKPRTLLGQRLNDLVRTTWAEVDVVGFCIAANEEVGRGDHYIAEEVSALGTPVVGVVTKTDLVSSAGAGRAAACRLETAGLRRDRARFCRTREQVDVLADVLVRLLPSGPPLYPSVS